MQIHTAAYLHAKKPGVIQHPRGARDIASPKGVAETFRSPQSQMRSTTAWVVAQRDPCGECPSR